MRREKALDLPRFGMRQQLSRILVEWATFLQHIQNNIQIKQDSNFLRHIFPGGASYNRRRRHSERESRKACEQLVHSPIPCLEPGFEPNIHLSIESRLYFAGAHNA